MGSNYIKNVAVVGAGGQGGSFFVEELLKTGKHTVTAITRTDSPNTFPSEVLVKKIDYSDPSSLVSALQGQDCLIITMSFFAPPDDQTKLIDAAAEAKVPWIFPNEYGSDPLDVQMGIENKLGPGRRTQRDHIDRLGMSSWIALTCGFWYEYSLAAGTFAYGFDLKNKSVTFFDDGTVRINTSTWPQCGRAVAALLSLKIEPESEGEVSLNSHFKNKPAYISSFTASQEDMLQSVLCVTGDSRQDWKITKVPAKERYEQGVKDLANGDRTGFGRLLYTRSFFPESNGNYGATRGLQNDILGLPTENIDDFTKIALARPAPSWG